MVTSGVKEATVLQHSETRMRLLTDRSQSSHAPLSAVSGPSVAPGPINLAHSHESDTTGAMARDTAPADSTARSTYAADIPLTEAEGKAGCCESVFLRVLVDRSVVEAYAMHGRAHLATRAYPANMSTSDVIGVAWVPTAGSSGNGTTAVTADIRVWRMDATYPPKGHAQSA